MATNKNPIFIKTPRTPTVAGDTAANTASDGSGSLITLFTAGTEGSRVEQVVFRNAQVTPALSSAMIGKIFLTDAAGANPKLVGEVLLAATTRSNTVAGASGTHTFSPPLLMAAGQILKICQSAYAGAQDLLSVTAYGGDY